MTATTTGSTCVLGHPWHDGQVLCPSCGFGPRATGAAAVQPAVAVPSSAVDDRPRSDDGRWVWNGAAWEPVLPVARQAEQLAPVVPAQAAPSEPVTPVAPTPDQRRRRGRPTPKALAIVGALVVVVAGGGAYALGAFGGSSSTPAPVVKGHPATAAAVEGGPLTPADVQVRAYVARYAAAETAWFAAHKTYADPLTVAGEPAQQEPPAAAVGVASYCVMDSAGSAGAHWFVASSRLGGLLPTAYATRAAASDACR